MKVELGGGSSGSPVLNRSGQVIGINAWASERYGYAIPSNVLKVLLAETETNGAFGSVAQARSYPWLMPTTFRENLNTKRGIIRKAIADFDKAVQLNSETLYTYHKRGEAKAALGEHEAAIADFDKAIQLDPEFADSYARKACGKSS